MPASKRTNVKSDPKLFYKNIPDYEGDTPPTLEQPSHAYMPYIGHRGNFLVEFVIFMFSITALGVQYMNLYRTVWWLPHSYAAYAMNFYLIDPHLAGILVIISSRRLLYTFCVEFYRNRTDMACLYYMVLTMKGLMVVAVLYFLLYCLYQVVSQYGVMYSLFLGYPFLSYAALFRRDYYPLFGKMAMVGSLKKPTYREVRGRDVPLHQCCMQPEVIREEVEIHREDFNYRLRQILFNSMTLGYYVGLLPVIFAQNPTCDTCWNTLHFNKLAVYQIMGQIWITSFLLFCYYLLPPNYVDSLHMSAVHLGKWVKVEGRHAHVPYVPWSELQVWPRLALVKHVKGLFRAEGFNNCAEPGSTAHLRFYWMFSSATIITDFLLVLTFLLVLWQGTLMVIIGDWCNCVSMALLLFGTYYILYQLARDKQVMREMYANEDEFIDGLQKSKWAANSPSS